MFGRDSGVIPCSECYWRTAKQKCTAVQEFQNCSPLLFWGIFQRENWLILGTSLYCHPFSPWLLSCVSDPACRVQRCLHLPVLHTGCSTKILVFHSPINSVFFFFCGSDLSCRAACLLLVDTEPGVIIIHLKCKHFANHLGWLIITLKGREA